MDLEKYIHNVPDYPKPGIIFKDITPLLGDAEAFHFVIDALAEKFAEQKPDVVVGIDARGFLLASAVAYKLGAGLAIVRKPGKLPRQTIREDYTLEYASNVLEMHYDAIKPGQNVLIIDDVLATGGTMEATCKMVEKLGGKIIGIGFLTELGFLNGKEKLKNYRIKSLVHYS
jgi:adenine phosphoribosyltransferase